MGLSCIPEWIINSLRQELHLTVVSPWFPGLCLAHIGTNIIFFYSRQLPFIIERYQKERVGEREGGGGREREREVTYSSICVSQRPPLPLLHSCLTGAEPSVHLKQLICAH